ncbi:hypothetical protein GCM10011374_23680 [Kocuria dechangensis]|uniref:Uncharacterized protein n=1 Tax=Kocuria dechangensis TaxID=1176249 RepID=A0A917GY54_9MICC|nr:hypothetical protein GCM10011374_23680 [Kocuria dechangensis]
MPEYPAHSHVFVDESKVGGYYLAASVVAAGDVSGARYSARTGRLIRVPREWKQGQGKRGGGRSAPPTPLVHTPS